MDVACFPDIFQAKMSELMETLEFVRTYIDDLLCITKGPLDDHLSKLKRVFVRLQDAQLKVNARKSSFCATETENLGCVLSRDGIKPQKKKVQAILALMPPRSVKEWHRFLGMVQYYRDIWARQSKMLVDNVKATIAKDVTLAYPDCTQGFEVYTDSSKLQLGAVITQANRP